ncbi:zeta toxin family protein [Halomonas garicola]|uniref:zeta toxin family protein n=1 Tax=Halomonas garicola TaxID=1690008 RepID=UPI00289EBFFE|nr:zeta toxin family protein [Halomonas garicola]
MSCDGDIQAEALVFARRNKQQIARKWTDKVRYAPEEQPVSIFMAGSPGAGKTEVSKEYVAAIDELKAEGFAGLGSILRIDPDDLREELPGYTGSNSWLFQGAVSILVEKIHDLMLKQRQSFILDGTLASLEVAQKNIERSLRKGRDVQIFFVYQHPGLAWQFVCSREQVEGRNIPLGGFVRQFLGVQDALRRIKQEYGAQVMLDMIIKNNDGTNQHWETDIDSVDDYLPEHYTHERLKSLLVGED